MCPSQRNTHSGVQHGWECVQLATLDRPVCLRSGGALPQLALDKNGSTSTVESNLPSARSTPSPSVSSSWSFDILVGYWKRETARPTHVFALSTCNGCLSMFVVARDHTSCSATDGSPRLLSPLPVELMKPWTTSEQLTWLKEQVPRWNKARSTKGKVTIWLEETVSRFLVTFKLPKSERIKAPSVSSPSLPPVRPSNNN